MSTVQHGEKQRLQQAIITSLSSVSGVLSVTLVGSFIDRADLTGISDIDTIVICDRLTEDIFNKWIEKAKAITPESVGLKGYNLKINTSFGPLKFDEPNLVVLHLMIYDVNGHRRHAVASPFTCLDWERSGVFEGKSLRDVFPVGFLQPRDFLEARRGLENYLEDLSSGTISIRDYVFGNNDFSEVSRTYPLDDRHKGEYAYHIVRNLVLNGLKLKKKENRLFSQDELTCEIDELLGGKRSEHSHNFRHLTQLKESRSKCYPEWVISWVKTFIDEFQKAFVRRWQSAQTIYFIRHACTAQNDGTFLGQGRDPGILSCELTSLSGIGIEKLYCSPAKRCLETAEVMAPHVQIIPDERLKEMIYGSAQGWTYKQLKECNPEISQAWAAGDDPHFPGGGENTVDVLARLQDFISELTGDKGETLAVMTHNVVLRSLIGEAHGLSPQGWHRLIITHAEPMEFKLLDGRIYANITRNQLEKIFAKLEQA